MRPAAVGFQCPECVKEGAKTTRSGRTAYGGLRPTDASVTSGGADRAQRRGVDRDHGHRRQRQPAGRLAGAADPGVLHVPGAAAPTSAGRSATPAAGTWLPGVVDGAYWQLVTSMFTHVQLWHIGFNMLALWVLGPAARARRGPGPVPGALLPLRPGRLGAGLLGADRSSAAPRRLRRDLRPDGRAAVVALKVGGDVRGILTWIGINFVITFVLRQHLLAGPPRRLHRRYGDRRGPRLRPARPPAYRRPGGRHHRHRGLLVARRDRGPHRHDQLTVVHIPQQANDNGVVLHRFVHTCGNAPSTPSHGSVKLIRARNVHDSARMTSTVVTQPQ